MKAHEREILKSLIQLVWADGTVDDRERGILGRMLAELELSPKDIQEVGQMMTAAPDQPDLQVILQKDQAEKSELMKLMLAFAMVKGHLNPPEMRYLYAMGSKLGIEREEFDELVASVRKLPSQK